MAANDLNLDPETLNPETREILKYLFGEFASRANMASSLCDAMIQDPEDAYTRLAAQDAVNQIGLLADTMLARVGGGHHKGGIFEWLGIPEFESTKGAAHLDSSTRQ